jgi:uncharacterized protein YoxC
MDGMDVLRIALIALALAGIWAVVELALTIKKARKSVGELTKEVTQITDAANQTISEVQPIITKVDGLMSDLEPTVQGLQPLLDKATTAVDVVTVDLASVNDILVDVSEVTDSASNVTSTVSKAANSAVSGVAGVVGKFTGTSKRKRRRLHGEVEHEQLGESVPVDPDQVNFDQVDDSAVADNLIEEDSKSSNTGYYTYDLPDSE